MTEMTKKNQPEILAQLKEFADDLYSQGYGCGVPSCDHDKWINAWAFTMYKVANGEKKYNDGNVDTVVECYNELDR